MLKKSLCPAFLPKVLASKTSILLLLMSTMTASLPLLVSQV